MLCNWSGRECTLLKCINSRPILTWKTLVGVCVFAERKNQSLFYDRCGLFRIKRTNGDNGEKNCVCITIHHKFEGAYLLGYGQLSMGSGNDGHLDLLLPKLIGIMYVIYRKYYMYSLVVSAVACLHYNKHETWSQKYLGKYFCRVLYMM